MSGLIARLPELAGLRRLGDRLAKTLWAERRSVVVLCSGPLALGALESTLQTSLHQMGADYTPWDACAEVGPRAGMSWREHLAEWSANPAAFSDRTEPPQLSSMPDVTLIRGIQHFDRAGQQAWFVFLRAWADWAHQLADAHATLRSLCLLLDAGGLKAALPSTDIHLEVEWAVQAHSALDLRLQVRDIDAKEEPGVSAWLQAIVPSLAGNDLALADSLVDASPRSVMDVEAALREYAESRGWRREGLRSELGRQVVDLGRPVWPVGLRLEAKVETLWARGLVTMTTEYGLELNSAVLAVLDERDAWHHRLWRGQVEWLLPLVDHVRLHACQALTRAHGADWPTRWQLPEGVSQEAAHQYNPLRCELGHLKALLWKQPELRRDGRVRPELIDRAHWIRNELAHYRPVEFAPVRELLMMVGAR
jgi:hypothetical protein